MPGLTNPCGRVRVPVLRGPGSEGSTAPEPRRQQDHRGEATLEHRSRSAVTVGAGPTFLHPRGAPMTDGTTASSRPPATAVVDRHIGPRPADVSAMLATLGLDSMDELLEQAVPKSIRADQALDLPAAASAPEERKSGG